MIPASIGPYFDSKSGYFFYAAILLMSAWSLFIAIDSIYKLYFHPLAKFSGPWQACLSRRWLLRISQTGHAEKIFEELHERYSRCTLCDMGIAMFSKQFLDTRALRIAPNELHLDEVSLYKTIYNQTSAYIKDPAFYAGFGVPHTLFGEDVPSRHKERRKILNPFFSRGAIVKIEQLLKEKTYELGARIDRQKGPCNAYNAFRCTTVDIISHYCAGKSLGQIKSSDKNFYGSFLVAFDAVAESIWQFIYQPALRKLITSMPKVVVKALSAQARSIFALADTAEAAASTYRISQPTSEYPIISQR
jgi:hypothetical protein